MDAVRTVAETVEGILPENRPSVPFADSLPEPKELVEFYFGFSQKLLDKQHEFATAILDAASPLEAGPGQGFEADVGQEGRLTDGLDRHDFFFTEPRALVRGFVARRGARLRRRLAASASFASRYDW